jgi:hypothetical protein
MSPTSCQTAPPRNRQARDHANQAMFFQGLSRNQRVLGENRDKNQWNQATMAKANCVTLAPGWHNTCVLKKSGGWPM